MLLFRRELCLLICLENELLGIFVTFCCRQAVVEYSHHHVGAPYLYHVANTEMCKTEVLHPFSVLLRLLRV